MQSSNLSPSMSNFRLSDDGLSSREVDDKSCMNRSSVKNDDADALVSPPFSPSASMARRPVRRPGVSRSFSFIENSSSVMGRLKTPYPQSVCTEMEEDILFSSTADSVSRQREKEFLLTSQKSVNTLTGEVFASALQRLSAQWRTAQCIFPSDHTEDSQGGKNKSLVFGNATTEREVNAFLAAYLAAGGHDKALQLFRRRLPREEHQLVSHCPQKQQQQQQQQQQTQRQPCEQLSSSGVSSERGQGVITTIDVYNEGWRRGESKEQPPLLGDAMNELVRTVCDVARRELLLDDMVPWPTVSCQRKNICLEPLEGKTRDGAGQRAEPAPGVAMGGTLDRLVEVLILTETDAPFKVGMPIFNYTNVFIVLSSLFVLPEVLVVRLIRLFRLVQKQQAMLDDGRSAFLQRRIVQFMFAFCQFHEVDMTSTCLERLLMFVGEMLGSISASNRNNAASSLTLPQYASSSFVNRDVPELTDRLRELSALAKEQLQRNFIRDDAAGVWRRRVDIALPPLGSLLHPPPAGAAAFLSVPTPPHAPKPVSLPLSADISFTRVDEETFAEQLCLLCFRLFLNIHIRELLHNAWSAELMRHGVSPHLSRLIDYAARLQRFVAAQILLPARARDRREAMGRGARLARRLFERQNYEAAAAVLAALQHPAVAALDAAAALLPPAERAELDELQEAMDPFAPLGTPSLLSSMSSRAEGDMEAPMIPLLAPVLGVLFRTEEAKGRTVVTRQSDGAAVVNWTKVVALGKNIFFWLRCQSMPYEYTVNGEIQDYLWNLPGHQYSDETLMRFAKKRRAK